MSKKFTRAIVRIPGHSISEGLLSSVYLEGRPNYQKAIVQHEQYVAALAKAGGVSVTALVVSLSVVLGIYLLLSFMALAPLMAAPMAGLAV